MRVSTGIEGLDDILCGGLLPGRTYLVYGEPGTGKTTLGLHFLSAGETGLLITFAQAAPQLRSDALSLGFKLNQLEILDLSPSAEVFSEVQSYDIFLPAEVEREPLSHKISNAVESLQPQRIFVDSFDYFRSLAMDPFQQRRLAQSFFRFATSNGATLVIGSEEQSCDRDVDGVIRLKCSGRGRSIEVTKFRGSDFRAGVHVMRLTSRGVRVPFPQANDDLQDARAGRKNPRLRA